MADETQVKLPAARWRWVDIFSIAKSMRMLLLAVIHLGIFMATCMIAFMMRFDFAIPDDRWPMILKCIPFVVSIKLACFYVAGSFHGWWRYISFSDLTALGRATFMSLIAIVVVDHFVLPFQIPRTVILVDILLTILLVGAFRSSWRFLSEEIQPLFSKTKLKRTLLVGTSPPVLRLAHQMKAHTELGFRIIGLVARDKKLAKRVFGNLRVLGCTDELQTIASAYRIEDVLVVAGSISGNEIRNLADVCKERNLHLRIIPAVSDMFHGTQDIPLRDVGINDLLRRDPVVLDDKKIDELVEGSTVLVTGAGGSIGSEICRQLLPFHPQKIILLGRGENRIFQLERELRLLSKTIEFVPVIADIVDEKRIESVFQANTPDIVFHAAAHKHVPLMEANVTEAIKNNLLGTRNVADNAQRFGVSHFVLISTDKVVNPSSIMGASKHLAERYIMALSEVSETRFMAVRFGNVLGSNGSVIPIFQQQIRSGGPLTITDERMTRFFMSIPEASQLVLQACSIGNGGEIFVLDMGEAVRIVDLAKDLIRLSGLPEDSIEIKFTGMREGEKLYEELYFDDELTLPTTNNKIFSAYHRSFALDEVTDAISNFEAILQSQEGESVDDLLRREVASAIPEFTGTVPAPTTEQRVS